MTALEVNDLRKRYDSFTALDGVSFRVAEGEMFGLLGPNGAGKTTLLSILSCLLDASGGSATLLGRPVSIHDRTLRGQIGIVPQDLAIYGELTARENLAFFGGLYGLAGADLARRCTEVLAAIGLNDRADDRAEAFSGGMKRRLNLGCALLHRPRLVMLDEPTTGVDPQSRNHIFEEVRRLNAAGVTIIYTSHYMEEVQSLCRRIAIIDAGKVLACDTLEGLLARFEGLIRLRVRPNSPELRDRLAALPGVRVTNHTDDGVSLQCADVKGTLLRVVALLTESKVDLVGLDMEEPNLERVFLLLTGHALRD